MPESLNLNFDLDTIYGSSRRVKIVHKCGRAEYLNIIAHKLAQEYRVPQPSFLTLIPATGPDASLTSRKTRTKVYKLEEGLFESVYKYSHEEMV